MRKRKRKVKHISGRTYGLIGLAFLICLIIGLVCIIWADESINYYDEEDTPFCGPNNVCYQKNMACAKPAFDDTSASKCISLNEQLKIGDTCWKVWDGFSWESSSMVCP